MQKLEKKLGVLLLILSGCIPIASNQNSPIEIYQDQDFAPHVGFCMVGSKASNGTFNNPVTPLHDLSLTLTFDLLSDEYQNLYSKIIHCDKNWKKSLLNEIEYLSDFNEFPINTYSFSQANLSTYVSYQQVLPTVKISGNYCVAVFNADNQTLLFTRRFLVTESLVPITTRKAGPIQNELRNTHHRLEIELQHSGLEIISPDRDISVLLLQNHDWRNLKYPSVPTEIRTSDDVLVYRPFDQSTTFKAGNDYRFFDISTLAAKGNNIASTFVKNGDAFARVEAVRSRANQVYSEPFLTDLNGGFILRNQNPFQLNDQSEYVKVLITLESEPLTSTLFLTSRYFQWRLLPQNQMKYDSTKHVYEGQIFVKQGFHNYKISSYSDNENEIEGNFQQTQNEYEILVYYRMPGTVYDRIVGYKLIL